MPGAAPARGYSLRVALQPPCARPGNCGGEVNPFGDGLDIVYRRHLAVNAVIVGWTATKADPATH